MFVEHKEAGEFTTPALDEASRLLLKAAALLEEHGWCQHERSNAGRHCVLGALDEAAGGDRNWGHKDERAPWWGAVQRLVSAVGATHPIGINWAAANWNNQPGRTKEEVIAKLRAVALGG